MRKILKITVVALAFLSLMLFAGSASALTFTFPDNTIAWPGYPNSGYDTIGQPEVDKMIVETDAFGDLDKVIIQLELGALVHRSEPDFLYINTAHDGAKGYEGWDFYVATGSYDPSYSKKFAPLAPTLFKVADVYQYYIIPVPTPGQRAGHPTGLISGFYDGTGISVVYDPVLKNIVYDFDPGIHFATGDRVDGVIGFTEWCANDVIITTPEPGTLLLLGFGLLGIGILRRKR